MGLSSMRVRLKPGGPSGFSPRPRSTHRAVIPLPPQGLGNVRECRREHNCPEQLCQVHREGPSVPSSGVGSPAGDAAHHGPSAWLPPSAGAQESPADASRLLLLEPRQTPLHTINIYLRFFQLSV